MKPHQYSYAFLSAFICTVFLLQWWQASSYPLTLWLILGSVGIVGYRERKKKMAQILLPASCGCALALLVVALGTHTPNSHSVDSYATEQKVALTGVIAAEPDRRPLQTKYTVQVHSIRTASGTSFPVNGKVLVTDHSAWPYYSFGDTVRVDGVLEIPSQIETFHYDRYLSRFGIYSVIYRATLSPFPKTLPRKLSLRRSMYAIKSAFEYQLNRIYPEPHASFMAGLLTGSRRGIPATLMEEFNRTGLTHIIAISGYNITIIITMISGLLFWLPLRTRSIPSIGIIILFTIFVGASAAVVRAAIMGILGLCALQWGRQTEMRLSIAWTLFFMLLWNPKLLWYDTGFQLSFLAVIGLTECSPILERYLHWVPQRMGIRESLIATLAAQIIATPLIVLIFGRISLVAPLANILVAPFIPLAMVFGFCGTCMSAICFPLGQLIAYIGWMFLEWIMLVARTLSALPYAALPVHTIHMYVVLGYYFFVCIWMMKERKGRPYV